MNTVRCEQILKGQHIFYIEDNLQNLALTHYILEQQGATVRYERWGNLVDTLMRLERFTPSLILTDLMLPEGVTGYDIFDGIRQHPEFNAIPIAAISAADPTREMPKARNKGFNGFIGKPLNAAMFPHQILALCNGENVWYAD